MKIVKAIFVSHEHSDHIAGMEVLSRKHGIPVYITPDTLNKSRINLASHLTRTFSANVKVEIDSLEVFPFPKQHDGVDSHSFTITSDGITAGVFTDIGMVCEHVIRHLAFCHAAFLEANYDEYMLEHGRYPLFLKRRIRGGKGHLSNKQSLELFTNHRSSFLELLILSHLSEHNNRPEIVQNLFAPHANGTKIAIASRYKETGVFCIMSDNQTDMQ